MTMQEFLTKYGTDVPSLMIRQAETLLRTGRGDELNQLAADLREALRSMETK